MGATAAFVGRMTIGGVLTVAGLGKLFGEPHALAQIVRAYQLLPDAWVGPAAVVLPLIEVVVGLAVLLAVSFRPAIAAAAVLFALFLGGMLSARLRGLTISDCGCLPWRHAEGLGWADIGRTGVLLGVAAALSARAGWPIGPRQPASDPPAAGARGNQLLVVTAAAIPLMILALGRVHGLYFTRPPLEWHRVLESDIIFFAQSAGQECVPTALLLGEAAREHPGLRVTWVDVAAWDAGKVRARLNAAFDIPSDERMVLPAVFSPETALVGHIPADEFWDFIQEVRIARESRDDLSALWEERLSRSDGRRVGYGRKPEAASAVREEREGGRS